MPPAILRRAVAIGALAAAACGDTAARRAPEPRDAGSDTGDACRALPATGAPDPVPAGWVHAPCQPAGCDVYFAPDPARARPASPWTSPPWLPCGGGCLALEDDWADPTHRLLAPLGAAGESGALLGYTRDLGHAGAGAGPFELQVVRLPENLVTLDAIALGEPAECALGLRALASDALLLQLDSAPERTWLAGGAGDAVPAVSERAARDRAVVEAAASASLWAASYGSGTVVEWHPLGAGAPRIAWSSPDGSTISGLVAHGSALLFGSHGGLSGSEILVWDEAHGARTLVGVPGEGVAGATTDGHDLVWFQGSGFHADTATWDEVWLMASPHTVRAADVHPRRVRRLAGGAVRGFRAAIGGGHVVLLSPASGDAGHELSVTRLTDGAFWILPEKEDFGWGAPLYVNADELAVPITLGGDLGIQAGVIGGEAFSIVRRTIASLGPPTAP